MGTMDPASIQSAGHRSLLQGNENGRNQKVTRGRIDTIGNVQDYIEENGIEDVKTSNHNEEYHALNTKERIAEVVQVAGQQDIQAHDIGGALRNGNTGVLDHSNHHQIHRHELTNKDGVSRYGSSISTLIFAIVMLHLLGLAVWIRAWWRQKKVRQSTMRSYSPSPPTKVSASYDMDGYMRRTSSVPRKMAEMAALVKGLDLKGLAGLKPGQA